jgi:hypothetical protein
MQHRHWRLAFGLAVAFLAALLVAAPAPSSAQATVRKSITALTPAELMSLRRGVATMMANNTASRGSATFRTSWIYWANMHAHFGSTCSGPIQGNGMAGVSLWTANTPTETQLWCKCEHRTNQFLTWHRMFLYYFERALRQAANDPALTLPYWDYTGDPRLPTAFREQTYVNESGQTVPNPLWVQARRPQLNSGAAGLGAGQVSTSNAMAASAFAEFGRRLEATPHGAVHCGIGSTGCGSGLMGAIPSAALDPIFYLHHANIDRLYECWMNVNPTGRRPTGNAILNRSYSFIDADGAVRQRRVRDMVTLSQLGYGYAPGAGCPAAPSGGVATMTAAEATTTEMPGAELQRGLTEVPLDLEPAGPGEPAGGPANLTGGEATSAVLTVEGVTVEGVPGAVYDVFLADEAGNREQVGVIDFFGFSGGGKGHDHGGQSQDFEFDVTEAVNSLGLSSGEQAKLVFEPSTGLTDSTPEAAMETIEPDAKVSYERLRLTIER